MANQIYQNHHSVEFMVWETNPQKRNTNNKMNLVTEKKLQEGDILIGQYGESGVSTYKISAILNSRPATLKGKTYYEIQVQWRNQSPAMYKSENLEHTALPFQRFISDFMPPKA